MSRYIQRAILLVLNIALLLGLVLAVADRATAQNTPNWLSAEAPQLTKITDLPAGADLDDGTACSPYTYKPTSTASTRTVCLFASPLGTLTKQGEIQTGIDQFVPLTGLTNSVTFLPNPNAGIAVASMPTANLGVNIGIYRHLTKANLRYNFGAYSASYYNVTVQPDETLYDPASPMHAKLNINTSGLAFSANGKWLVADMPQRGLVRINMEDISDVQQFAGALEPSWYSSLANMPMAISDDGRYAVVDTDIFGYGNMKVFDLSTCTNQMDVPAAQAHYCASKDIWYNSDAGKGILAANPGLKTPRHIEFSDDDSLSVYATKGSDSSGNPLVASYVVTAPGAVQHGIGLLGMGDSYIAGQGAYAYRPESDTTNDTCHVSDLAYPTLLGKEFFNSYNSIACSGAITSAVSGTDYKNYEGQVNDGIKEQNRDRGAILANFLPGYLYQQEFAAHYKPEAILLSVGGDDIGFGNIVKQCVLAPADSDTCYAAYEDRAELVNLINATYAKLVATYTTLRQQSNGARVYVVGYPQVAKPGGDCGLNVHLNAQELTFAEQLISYLDGVVQQAASTAGVYYVDTQHAFDGHKLCESGDKAMNGLTQGDYSGFTVPVINAKVNVIASESYHPTPLGYQLLAQTIAAQTQNLTAPMPVVSAYGVPKFNPAIPFLTEVPATGRTINWVTHSDDMTSDFILRGDTQQLTLSGNDTQLEPGSNYQIVLHSTPVTLNSGTTDLNGDIKTTVQIPLDTAPGYHVLHVYGTNMAGQPIDVQETIYVAATADDWDGDGVPNIPADANTAPDSGQAATSDPVDDTPDPETVEPPATNTPAQSEESTPQDQPEPANPIAQTIESSIDPVELAQPANPITQLQGEPSTPQTETATLLLATEDQAAAVGSLQPTAISAQTQNEPSVGRVAQQASDGTDAAPGEADTIELAASNTQPPKVPAEVSEHNKTTNWGHTIFETSFAAVDVLMVSWLVRKRLVH